MFEKTDLHRKEPFPLRTVFKHLSLKKYTRFHFASVYFTPVQISQLLSLSLKPSSMSLSGIPCQIFRISLWFTLIQVLQAVPSIIPINGTCSSTCGSVPINYPFGSGFGCGHPDFARYIRCSSGALQFSTGTGVYAVSSVDYTAGTLIVDDPFMSTCASMQDSGSFRLDRNSPFTVDAGDIFVLLGCSTTSPIFDSSIDLCDTGSASHVCRGLYSCRSITGIGLEPNAPISSCCVYDPPIDRGSDYGLDLPKLQCTSYSSIYGFGGNEGDPMKWEFGISLRFNGSYYGEDCRNCEDSGGLCGYSRLNEAFACVCHNGMNTTTNCFGRGYAWNQTWRQRIQPRIIVGGFLLAFSVFIL